MYFKPADSSPLRQWRGKPVARWHAMIKATGPVCNLKCAYCYYLHKLDLLATDSRWRMNDETLEAVIHQHIGGHNHPAIIFSWQGGEPTLLGLDFFRKVVALQKKYCPPHQHCENDLQTNGTNLTDEWCAFLKEHDFLVGISIDGPAQLHDHYRVGAGGQGTHAQVLRGIRLLQKHAVPFATLTCVNRLTAQNPLQVYRYLRDEVRSQRIQLIPIVEPKSFRTTAPQFWKPEDMPLQGSDAARPGTSDSVVEPWCCDPDEFGNFLCKVFDEWYAHDLGRVYVHYFDAAVEIWMGRMSPICTHGSVCGKGIAIEHDGSVYSCDHYVYPEYRTGNVRDTPLSALTLSSGQEYFGTNKERALPAQCRHCDYQFACYGECPKNRFIRARDGEPGLNYLCSGWQRYYKHIDERVQSIVRRLGYTPVRTTHANRAAGESALGHYKKK